MSGVRVEFSSLRIGCKIIVVVVISNVCIIVEPCCFKKIRENKLFFFLYDFFLAFPLSTPLFATNAAYGVPRKDKKRSLLVSTTLLIIFFSKSKPFFSSLPPVFFCSFVFLYLYSRRIMSRTNTSFLPCLFCLL